MNDMREEFKKIRLRNNKNAEIKCSRCGILKSKKSIEYHHIKPICDGGDNSKDNLIPLCKDCHDDWHILESYCINFNDFLNIPTFSELALSYYYVKQFQKVDVFKSIPESELNMIVSKCVNEHKNQINNAKTQARRRRQAKGIAAAKEKGIHIGRPKTEYPIMWEEVYKKWKDGEVTATKAMEMLQLKRTTFYKLVKQYEGDN